KSQFFLLFSSNLLLAVSFYCIGVRLDFQIREATEKKGVTKAASHSPFPSKWRSKSCLYASKSNQVKKQEKLLC
ncbi:TPA: hypothetical protein QFN59_000001, partial [Enterococcus faecium]